MNQIIADFIDEHKLIPILREEIVGRPRWFERKARVLRFAPYITTTVEFDPVTGTVPTQYENGRKAVSHKDIVDFIEDEPITNADAIYIVPAGTQKKIAQIHTDLEVAVGGANRDFTITVIKAIAGVAILNFMVTGAITVLPGNPASIAMAQSGPTWLNNAGVIANEDTNIVGIILQAGDSIVATWTNKVADDRCRLSVGEIDLPVI